jgi:hypothetical protein
MKFSVGYQLPDEHDSISQIVADYHEQISDVYFALPGAASGRMPLGLVEGVEPEVLRAVQEEELLAMKALGVKLTLLYNANCYGDAAISADFAREIEQTVSALKTRLDLDTVTTTSPFVAHIIKSRGLPVEVRASVNMRIGTLQALEQLSATFDSYYLQRDFNRDLERVGAASRWCRERGKGLHLLANSGCLRFCAFQTYHDNLVAHEAGVSARDNLRQKYPSPCWQYLEDLGEAAAAAIILQATWIRPDDIHHYEGLVDEMKLATRLQANPRRVISAYCRGRFRGNLFDLTEPSYAGLFRNKLLDATRIPADWFEQTTQCDKQCQPCRYCQDVARQALISFADLERSLRSWHQAT